MANGGCQRPEGNHPPYSPTDKSKQVREFLGNAGFCRLWVPGFAEMAALLYPLTKKWATIHIGGEGTRSLCCHQTGPDNSACAGASRHLEAFPSVCGQEQGDTKSGTHPKIGPLEKTRNLFGTIGSAAHHSQSSQS